MNEAYTVLRDDAKRRQYLAEVTGADRPRKLRFTEAEEALVKEQQKRKVEAQYGQTPNGRKLYAAAQKDIEAGRWEPAERALRMALMYEPANERFKGALARVEKAKPKADLFRIR